VSSKETKILLLSLIGSSILLVLFILLGIELFNSYQIENNNQLAEAPIDIKFEELETFLASKDFYQADVATRKLMLKLTNTQNDRWVDKNTIVKMSCKDVLIIDKLWQDYSDGKFGFSQQRKIYITVGNNEKFGNKVGWRKNNKWLSTDDLIYTTEAPIGHLPSVSRAGLLSNGWLVWYFLPSMSPAEMCLKP